jgi:hypothetical protein
VQTLDIKRIFRERARRVPVSPICGLVVDGFTRHIWDLDKRNPDIFAYPWMNPAAVLSKALGLKVHHQGICCACGSGNCAVAWA